jgi:hypothetical protein
MMSHRLLALLLATLPAAALGQPAEWRFEVFLNDKPIGYHSFSLDGDGSEQVLTTEASFDVKLLFITAFRYRHENTEIWRNGCLNAIDARTNSNGKQLDVFGELRGEAFAVMHNGGIDTLNECVRSFAYWNPSILAADRLLNSQTGEYEKVEVRREAADLVMVGDTAIEAERYTLSAKGGDITLWYAREGYRWLALEAPAKGGRRIRYQPVNLPAPDTFAQMSARID